MAGGLALAAGCQMGFMDEMALQLLDSLRAVRRISHGGGDTEPDPSPTPPRPGGFPRCLRFQRRQQKAAWRQRGAAGPRAGAWPGLRGFGSACICVGSGLGRAA